MKHVNTTTGIFALILYVKKYVSVTACLIINVNAAFNRIQLAQNYHKEVSLIYQFQDVVLN